MSIGGLSEYEAARIATEADYAAGQFNRNLSQNNGDQGVYVVAKGGMPDDAQREMITNQLRMKRAMQQRGQFRPAFIAGDVEIQDPKIQAPDGDFWAGRLANRHEIFIAFGVPPSMADKMESYSVGLGE
jgi:phage portal protein BeeE